MLIFIEKFSTLPGFEPVTSPVPSHYATNWAILAWISQISWLKFALGHRLPWFYQGSVHFNFLFGLNFEIWFIIAILFSTSVKTESKLTQTVQINHARFLSYTVNKTMWYILQFSHGESLTNMCRSEQIFRKDLEEQSQSV